MQENLKKAFMRGVCALNLEAMNALNPASASMDMFASAMNMQAMGSVEENSLATFSGPGMESAMMQTPAAKVPELSATEPKIESKDHLWKPAPILAKDFGGPTIVRPAVSSGLGGVTMKLDGRSTLLMERREETGNITSAGEREVKCERVQNEVNSMEEDAGVEGVEARNFGMAKQTVNMQQMESMSSAEGKVIRVNKYGKSYIDLNAKKEMKAKTKVGCDKKKVGLANSKK